MPHVLSEDCFKGCRIASKRVASLLPCYKFTVVLRARITSLWNCNLVEYPLYVSIILSSEVRNTHVRQNKYNKANVNLKMWQY